MGDVTLLRTLTKKSLLKFGKFADMMVGNVIKLGQQEVGYLAWIYYNSDKINFTDDILLEINIIDNLKIDKPGKNPEMIKFWRMSLSHLDREELSRRIALSLKAERAKGCALNRKNFSGKRLMDKNHGHK